MKTNPRPTFNLRHHNQDRWNILTENDTPAFTGTLTECEAWLDQEERTATKPANSRISLESILTWLYNLYSRPVTATKKK